MRHPYEGYNLQDRIFYGDGNHAGGAPAWRWDAESPWGKWLSKDDPVRGFELCASWHDVGHGDLGAAVALSPCLTPASASDLLLRALLYPPLEESALDDLARAAESTDPAGAINEEVTWGGRAGEPASLADMLAAFALVQEALLAARARSMGDAITAHHRGGPSSNRPAFGGATNSRAVLGGDHGGSGLPAGAGASLIGGTSSGSSMPGGRMGGDGSQPALSHLGAYVSLPSPGRLDRVLRDVFCDGDEDEHSEGGCGHPQGGRGDGGGHQYHGGGRSNSHCANRIVGEGGNQAKGVAAGPGASDQDCGGGNQRMASSSGRQEGMPPFPARTQGQGLADGGGGIAPSALAPPRVPTPSSSSSLSSASSSSLAAAAAVVAPPASSMMQSHDAVSRPSTAPGPVPAPTSSIGTTPPHMSGTTPNNSSSSSGAAKASGCTFTTSARGMLLKTAPPGSLLATLALHLAGHAWRGAPAVASLWVEFVNELRWHWDEGVAIPGMAAPQGQAPDLGACLLQQKLELLQQCVLRKAAREGRHWGPGGRKDSGGQEGGRAGHGGGEGSPKRRGGASEESSQEGLGRNSGRTNRGAGEGSEGHRGGGAGSPAGRERGTCASGHAARREGSSLGAAGAKGTPGGWSEEEDEGWDAWEPGDSVASGSSAGQKRAEGGLSRAGRDAGGKDKPGGQRGGASAPGTASAANAAGPGGGGRGAGGGWREGLEGREVDGNEDEEEEESFYTPRASLSTPATPFLRAGPSDAGSSRGRVSLEQPDPSSDGAGGSGDGGAAMAGRSGLGGPGDPPVGVLAPIPGMFLLNGSPMHAPILQEPVLETEDMIALREAAILALGVGRTGAEKGVVTAGVSVGKDKGGGDVANASGRAGEPAASLSASDSGGGKSSRGGAGTSVGAPSAAALRSPALARLLHGPEGHLLCSDMAAFKAANPGAVLEDFVRWHSPRDWVPVEGSAAAKGAVEIGPGATAGAAGGGKPQGADLNCAAAPGGALASAARVEGMQLSTRMREAGNQWQSLWEHDTPPMPAALQPPLFDHTREAEKVLHYLANSEPGELLSQLFAVAAAVSFQLLASAAVLHPDPFHDTGSPYVDSAVHDGANTGAPQAAPSALLQGLRGLMLGGRRSGREDFLSSMGTVAQEADGGGIWGGADRNASASVGRDAPAGTGGRESASHGKRQVPLLEPLAAAGKRFVAELRALLDERGGDTWRPSSTLREACQLAEALALFEKGATLAYALDRRLHRQARSLVCALLAGGGAEGRATAVAHVPTASTAPMMTSKPAQNTTMTTATPVMSAGGHGGGGLASSARVGQDYRGGLAVEGGARDGASAQVGPGGAMSNVGAEREREVVASLFSREPGDVLFTLPGADVGHPEAGGVPRGVSAHEESSEDGSGHGGGSVRRRRLVQDGGGTSRRKLVLHRRSSSQGDEESRMAGAGASSGADAWRAVEEPWMREFVIRLTTPYGSGSHANGGAGDYGNNVGSLGPSLGLGSATGPETGQQHKDKSGLHHRLYACITWDDFQMATHVASAAW
eukprot:jgi/Mesvir1/21462/Mv03918-RA.1